MSAARVRITVKRAAREFYQSLLFYPVLITVTAIGLFALTTWVDRQFFGSDPKHDEMSLLSLVLFSGSPDAAQSLLSAIASMWASITGVIFSVTLVALTLSATKYSAQVVPHFEKDRLNQVVLGTFTGTVVYSLLVLKTVRTGGNGDGFTPIIGTNVSIALAIISLFLLVMFLQNIANYIQPKMFVDDLAGRIRRNRKAVLGPVDEKGYEPVEAPRDTAPAPAAEEWVPICVPDPGYLQGVDWGTLRHTIARLVSQPQTPDEPRIVGRLELLRKVGDHVSEGDPLARFHLPGVELGKEECDLLMTSFVLQDKRTIAGDPEYGLSSLADISLTAMSGGGTDVGVAQACTREHFALLRSFVGLPDPCDTFIMHVGRSRILLTLPPDSLIQATLTEARRTHDKAVKEGYWEVLEREVEGIASTLERAAGVGAYDRFQEVLEWFRAAIPDYYGGVRDPHALTRMVTRMATCAATLRQERAPAHAEEILATLREGLDAVKDPDLRNRLLEVISGAAPGRPTTTPTAGVPPEGMEEAQGA